MYFLNVTACIILFIDGIVFKWKTKTVRNYWRCLPSDFYWLETALLSSFIDRLMNIIIITNISTNKYRFKWFSGCLTFSLVCTEDQKLYYTAEEIHLSLDVEKKNWGTYNYRQSTHKSSPPPILFVFHPFLSQKFARATPSFYIGIMQTLHACLLTLIIFTYLEIILILLFLK